MWSAVLFGHDRWGKLAITYAIHEPYGVICKLYQRVEQKNYIFLTGSPCPPVSNRSSRFPEISFDYEISSGKSDQPWTHTKFFRFHVNLWIFVDMSLSLNRLCRTHCGLGAQSVFLFECPPVCLSPADMLDFLTIFSTYLQIESNSVRFGSAAPPHSPVISWILVTERTRESLEAGQRAVPPRCSECLPVWRKHIPLLRHHIYYSTIE